ncbi:MAG TPA: hypothetical protein VIS74_04170, partial [Chthoniobacterales bacterium]
MKLSPVFGQPSWRLKSDSVQLALTQTGGHLGPVTFKLGGKFVQPFHVAPWHGEKRTLAGLPPILQALRGDFFCMPFGGNEKPYGRERHPVHGETANREWTLESATDTSLRASLRTEVRSGRVLKEIFLRPGQTALYVRHQLEGFRGPMSFGHHAMLKFATEAHLSTSPFVYGQVFPGQFENPARGGYSSLRAGVVFKSLRRVPLAAGGFADLSRYPAREGFEDLVMVCAGPRQPLAWTAAAFPREGFVWFALKDPRVLASTVFWHSNGGRHYAPWNGRHRGVLGLEEVTSYFHTGLAESAAPNPVSARGIPTS